MSKPGWEDAPSWAQYLAMDADGGWYWYSTRPEKKNDCWWLFAEQGRQAFAEATAQWWESLEERP